MDCSAHSACLPYKIGDTTSMGWKVLNIEYEYKDNYYTELEYNKLIHESKEKLLKHTHTKEQYLEDIKKIMYYFIAAIIINFLKKILGI